MCQCVTLEIFMQKFRDQDSLVYVLLIQITQCQL